VEAGSFIPRDAGVSPYGPPSSSNNYSNRDAGVVGVSTVDSGLQSQPQTSSITVPSVLRQQKLPLGLEKELPLNLYLKVEVKRGGTVAILSRGKERIVFYSSKEAETNIQHSFFFRERKRIPSSNRIDDSNTLIKLGQIFEVMSFLNKFIPQNKISRVEIVNNPAKQNICQGFYLRSSTITNRRAIAIYLGHYIPQTAAHEMGHAIFDALHNNPDIAKKDHFWQLLYYWLLSNNQNFALFKDSSYSKKCPNGGHPWDDAGEFFASLTNIMLFDYEKLTQALDQPNLSPETKELGKLAVAYFRMILQGNFDPDKHPLKGTIAMNKLFQALLENYLICSDMTGTSNRFSSTAPIAVRKGMKAFINENPFWYKRTADFALAKLKSGDPKGQLATIGEIADLKVADFRFIDPLISAAQNPHKNYFAALYIKHCILSNTKIIDDFLLAALVHQNPAVRSIGFSILHDKPKHKFGAEATSLMRLTFLSRDKKSEAPRIDLVLLSALTKLDKRFGQLIEGKNSEVTDEKFLSLLLDNLRGKHRNIIVDVIKALSKGSSNFLACFMTVGAKHKNARIRYFIASKLAVKIGKETGNSALILGLLPIMFADSNIKIKQAAIKSFSQTNALMQAQNMVATTTTQTKN